MTKIIKSTNIVPQDVIESKIYLIRGKKVMLDKNLASLYGVTTGNLNKAVKRNTERFPNDFMFQLTKKEFNDLKFQIGISSWGGTRKLPYAFTEQGIAMLSGVLKSKKAIEVNITIMRIFVKIREMAVSYKSLARKIEELEEKYGKHNRKIKDIFIVLKYLIEGGEEEKKKKEIGFRVK